MFEDRSYSRTFFSAPVSVSSAFASVLEPAIMVATYAGVSMAFDEQLSRSDVVLCVVVFALIFPGRNRFRQTWLAAGVDIVASWLGLLAILAAFGFATRSLQLFDRRVILWWAALTPGLQLVAAGLGRRVVLWLDSRAWNRRSAVIIGAGLLGMKVAKALQAGDQEVTVLGFFDDRSDDRVHVDAVPLRRGALKDLAPFVRANGVHEVYITLPLGTQPRIVRLLEDVQGTTASVFFVPDVFGISIIQGRLQDVNGVPVVGICETPFTGTNHLVKRISDIVIASVILILISPLMLALAVGIKLSSPGPVIFRQRRNGLDGEEIYVYKFRSMRAMDDGPTVKQAQKGDSRITPFGGFLRRTSLDELPQFINVLQGRMSVVGPRPHAVAHNEEYRQMIKAYMVRHKVRPGITGWAQVNGYRGETDTVDKMQARVEYDLEYLRNWSLGLDLQIIARTVKLVFFDRNAY